MRLAVAASSAVAIPTLEHLQNSPHQLVRIFTTSDSHSGRGRALKQSEIAEWASRSGADLVKVGSATEMQNHLRDLDCVITIAFGILLPEDILGIPTHGFINLHFSVLPAWRGAAPVQRAIEHGDELIGATVFQLDRGMDTGPIYRSLSLTRDPDLRSKEVLELLSREGVQLVADSLDDIAAGVIPRPQSDVGASLAPKILKSEAVVDWSRSAIEVHNKICALFPNPVAFTRVRGKVLKITKCFRVRKEFSGNLSVGEIVIENDCVFVICAEGAIELKSVIPEGKGEMDASAWARGFRPVPGELCG
ncbi:MAG: hypothetical protein RIS05_312 [Actinomycetota bacterium]